MSKPTVAQINADLIALRQVVDAQAATIASLEAQIREIPGKVRGAAAPVPAIVGRNRPSQTGLVQPTCLNFRKCGNKSEGVSVQEAIGWKCPSCSGESS